MARTWEINSCGPGNQWLRSRKSMAAGHRKPMVGAQESNGCHGVQDINGSGTGSQWLGPRISMLGTRNPMVGVQETNDWSPTDQWLVPTKPMVGVQEINGWGPGNQWLRPRKQMVGVKEVNGCGVREINGGGTGNHWLWPSCLAGGGEVDRGEAASERSMCRALGRERDDMAGKAECNGVPERDGEGGRESERERER